VAAAIGRASDVRLGLSSIPLDSRKRASRA
jgi:hypothetical protein